MRNVKIIAFGNYRYKKIALNWATYLKSHNIDNYLIYSLDNEIYNLLVSHDVNTELLEIDIFEGKLKWHMRFGQIRKLLDNESILHSDLDAIWLQNPLCFIEPIYDIVSSVGTFPHKNACCMGWIYFKACDDVKKVFDRILNQNKVFDDQREFNIEIVNHDLKIKKLGQDIISREKSHDRDTYVAHPLSDKNCGREEMLRNKKLWILD
jgi:L-rhamnose mutarotase